MAREAFLRRGSDEARQVGGRGGEYGLAARVLPVAAREDAHGAEVFRGDGDEAMREAVLVVVARLLGGGFVFILVVAVFEGGERAIQFLELRLLRLAGNDAAFAARADRGFFDVGKERAERIEVARGDRIVFVIVALGAHEGLPQPGGADALHAVHDVLGFVLPGLRATFLGGENEAVVGTRDELRVGAVGKQITGDLLDGELVEAFVLLERADHPVAPRPDGHGVVAVVADGVGVAHLVQPPDGEALGVSGGGEDGLDGRGGLLRRGRQAGEVEGKAAHQSGGAGGRRGLDVFCGEAGVDEGIYRMRGAGRDRRTHRRDVGPVRLVFRTLGNPAAEDFLLLRSELPHFFGRRHHVIGIAGEQALHHFTLVRLARNDGLHPVVFGQRAVASVEAAVGFAGILVEPVAAEAGIRENGAHVAVVLRLLQQRRLGCDDHNGTEQAEDGTDGAHGTHGWACAGRCSTSGRSRRA